MSVQYSPAINPANAADFIRSGLQSAFPSFAEAAHDPRNSNLALNPESISVLFEINNQLFNDRAMLPGVNFHKVSPAQEAGNAGSYTLAPDAIVNIAAIQETYRA